MSDDQLIRRGDAIAAMKAKGLPFGYRHAVEAINTTPAVQVGVKQLEWFEGDEPDEWRADDYDVWCELGKFQVYHWSIVMGEPHETVEAAKAAAQADHEARIRSDLAVQPSPDVAALVVKVIDDRIAAIIADEESIMSPARQVISRWASSVISELENIRAALARLKGGA